ncbi:esterase-like activity of phytase family protein [Tepidamorphus sp. 3E244]|uniref:esterase-like activity of phytase family protein n=1 Tax=Tepidamorphus sp. 3E244 TaxID=3385498 RepID=UPI0038FD0AEE
MRLAAALALAAVLALPAHAQESPLTISATPIEIFDTTATDKTTFGQLRWLGGLVLTSEDERFGGISGVALSADGTALTAVSDTGDWLRARLESADSRPIALRSAVMGPLRGTDGARLSGKRQSDAEAISPIPGMDGFVVGFERNNRLLRYAGAENPIAGTPGEMPVPDDFRDLPENKGPEAIVVLPAEDQSGRVIVAIAERAVDGLLSGFILGRGESGRFKVKAHEAFDATDAALAPNGDILLLQRRFSILTGPSMAISRIAREDIADGATIEPELLMAADATQEIDNMEALGVHESENGRTILTILSDNNFNSLQRTVLLRFEWVP